MSNGFVVDSTGEVSRQMDLILYDRLNTPRIFTSDGAQMFPVEATYACGEIKAELNSSKFHDSFDKCLSYKRLRRSTYFDESNKLVKTTHLLFGSRFNHWQSIFFCVAAKSIKATTLLTHYNAIVANEGLKIHERIDTVVSLSATDGENCLLNVCSVLDGNVPSDRSIDLLPSPDSRMYCYQAQEPWSLFVMLLLCYMNQAPTVPVNMLPYGGNDPY